MKLFNSRNSAFPTLVFGPSKKILKGILVLFHNALNGKVLYCGCILKLWRWGGFFSEHRALESLFSSALSQRLWKNCTVSCRQSDSSNSRGQRKQKTKLKTLNLIVWQDTINKNRHFTYENENAVVSEIQITNTFYIRRAYWVSMASWTGQGEAPGWELSKCQKQQAFNRKLSNKYTSSRSLRFPLIHACVVCFKKDYLGKSDSFSQKLKKNF